MLVQSDRQAFIPGPNVWLEVFEKRAHPRPKQSMPLDQCARDINPEMLQSDRKGATNMSIDRQSLTRILKYVKQ